MMNAVLWLWRATLHSFFKPSHFQPVRSLPKFSLLRSFVSNAAKALWVWFANMFCLRQMTCHRSTYFLTKRKTLFKKCLKLPVDKWLLQKTTLKQLLSELNFLKVNWINEISHNALDTLRQFHQYFTCNFCADFLLPKNYKYKL